MNKFWKIVIYIGLPFSIIGTVSCICILFHRTNNLGIDYIGVIVGILSLLVTVLIGCNIYQVIDIKQEWRENRKYTERLENELCKAKDRLGKEQNAIRHYGYAITDFCQVYVKLEPEKKDYWSTYCKSLSALKNFLNTNEDLNWYAPACISNMEEALRKAQELNEICSEETSNNIRTYLDEIRTCPLDGFSDYWEKIEYLERKRKSLIHKC